MSSNVLHHRIEQLQPGPNAGIFKESSGAHPAAGSVKHGIVKQCFLLSCFVLYLVLCFAAIHTAQFAGCWLYFVNRDYYYAWMSVTKQFFGLWVNNLTQWFSPTVVRISSDKSVQGQFRLTKNGRLISDFPERLVMMANHQIYTDWLYLWWISYTARMHGHIYIILKESLKYIPFIGPGMLFYNFIFLARNWTKDKPTFQKHLKQLNSRRAGLMSGSQALEPMWLLIFPEGTNLSPNGRKASQKWAEKTGLRDMQHQLLPRSTGLLFCLQELRNTVDWLYDCTIAYEGIGRGEYGQDVFSLRSQYFQGCFPRSINMYWRRFPMSDIPTQDPQVFEHWLHQRWQEKDDLIEHYLQTGRFPANDDHGPGTKNNSLTKQEHLANHAYLETEVRSVSRFEVLLMFVPISVLIIFVSVVNRYRT